MRCGTAHFGWIAMCGEAAKPFDVLADKIEATEMVDPKQNTDFQSQTMSEQLRAAIRTIETELSVPDGQVVSQDDVSEVNEALSRIKTVVDRIETKLAGYSAQHREKPRST